MAKVGLALSGGGFRAAFFHVGVLARLAELGELRRVEVISTVSGGSVVGAAYYLRLRELLQEKPDAGIEDRDYVEVVQDVAAALRAAVEKDVRARIFSNLGKNLWMASPRYSRTDRLGDLFDRHLYKPIWERTRTRPGRSLRRDTQIALSEILIAPRGGTAGFRPADDNGPRGAKVPILIVNATSLNSGHNWRFEAVRMGEPPLPDDPAGRATVADVDKNVRYEVAYFDPARAAEGVPIVPEVQRDFPLALAVAASACVPGLLHPLSISGMYRDTRVELVDGGVHDNQGVTALRDVGCDVLIVSDGSGQMLDAEHPGTRIPGVVARAGAVARDRIREEELTGVELRRGSPKVMHLRKGLGLTSVAPLGARETGAMPDETLCFGVDPRVQRALARIRTDFDRFSDDEAFSLALDGYLMTGHEYGQLADPGESTWDFAARSREIREPGRRYLRALEAGRAHVARWTVVLLAVVLVAIVAVHLDTVRDALAEPVWLAIPLAVVLVAGLYASSVRRINVAFDALALVLGVLAWIPALLMLAAHRVGRRHGPFGPTRVGRETRRSGEDARAD